MTELYLNPGITQAGSLSHCQGLLFSLKICCGHIYCPKFDWLIYLRQVFTTQNVSLYCNVCTVTSQRNSSEQQQRYNPHWSVRGVATYHVKNVIQAATCGNRNLFWYINTKQRHFNMKITLFGQLWCYLSLPLSFSIFIYLFIYLFFYKKIQTEKFYCR